MDLTLTVEMVAAQLNLSVDTVRLRRAHRAPLRFAASPASRRSAPGRSVGWGKSAWGVRGSNRQPEGI